MDCVAQVNKCGLYRNIVFTLNNYTDLDIQTVLTCKHFKYVIIGKEIAPSTGTPHLQGYAELIKSMRFNALKKLFPTMHFEARYSSQTQAINYCKKDGDWTESGQTNRPGDRTDLRKQRDMIKAGVRLTELVEDQDLSPNQCKSIKEYYTLFEPARDRDTPMLVYWYYGPTGSGKSKQAWDLYGDDMYVKDCNSKWWDGYDGQETILFDDIRPNSFSFNWLLNITDRYPLRVEVKGGYRQFRSKRIIFTCPLSPNEFCYKMLNVAEVGEDINQLLRRITDVMRFDCLTPPKTVKLQSKTNPFKSQSFVACSGGSLSNTIVKEPPNLSTETLEQNLKNRLSTIESTQMVYQQEIRNLFLSLKK